MGHFGGMNFCSCAAEGWESVYSSGSLSLSVDWPCHNDLIHLHHETISMQSSRINPIFIYLPIHPQCLKMRYFGGMNESDGSIKRWYLVRSQFFHYLDGSSLPQRTHSFTSCFSFNAESINEIRYEIIYMKVL